MLLVLDRSAVGSTDLLAFSPEGDSLAREFDCAESVRCLFVFDSVNDFNELVDKILGFYLGFLLPLREALVDLGLDQWVVHQFGGRLMDGMLGLAIVIREFDSQEGVEIGSPEVRVNEGAHLRCEFAPRVSL